MRQFLDSLYLSESTHMCRTCHFEWQLNRSWAWKKKYRGSHFDWLLPYCFSIFHERPTKVRFTVKSKNGYTAIRSNMLCSILVVWSRQSTNCTEGIDHHITLKGPWHKRGFLPPCIMPLWKGEKWMVSTMSPHGVNERLLPPFFLDPKRRGTWEWWKAGKRSHRKRLRDFVWWQNGAIEFL